MATVSNMLSSIFPPEISLIIAAPFFIDSAATLLLKVSTEIKIFGKCLTSNFITGTIRCNSSSSEICVAPGREEYAPTSIKVAPSKIIFSVCCKISDSFLYFPPSKKESGVIFKIPITFGDDKSIRFPLQFIVILIYYFINYVRNFWFYVIAHFL